MGLSEGTTDSCDCDANYEWNSTEYQCVIKCGGVDNQGQSREDNNVEECVCNSNRYWNST